MLEACVASGMREVAGALEALEALETVVFLFLILVEFGDDVLDDDLLAREELGLEDGLA